MANAAGKQLEWRTKDIAPPTSSRKLVQLGYDFL